MSSSCSKSDWYIDRRSSPAAPDAREVSAAAADPGDSALKARAKVADTTLRGHFSTGPETLRDSGFVALSQTIPCLLGNAWFALIQHPDQWGLLHNEPALIDQAVEELLRYAGLVRVLFRVATTDIDLDGLQLRKGTRLILRIIAGNRDEAHFDDPNTLNIARRGSGHLSLGMGPTPARPEPDPHGDEANYVAPGDPLQNSHPCRASGMAGRMGIPFPQVALDSSWLLNAAKVMSSSQVELPNAAQSRTEGEISSQGLKALVLRAKIYVTSPEGTAELSPGRSPGYTMKHD